MDLQEQINTLSNRLIEVEEQLQTLSQRLFVEDRASRAQIMFLKRQLKQSQSKEDEVPVNEVTDEILISNVSEVYYVKEYQYKDTTFEQFLVTLDDNKKYYVDRFKGSKPKIVEGNKISYKIDGDKLRNLRVLFEA